MPNWPISHILLLGDNMFGSNIVRSGFSLTKMLSGLNRGLSLANQVIPIYQQAKPMISNARQILATMREFAHTDVFSNPQKSSSNNIVFHEKNTILKNEQSFSNPVFFQ